VSAHAVTCGGGGTYRREINGTLPEQLANTCAVLECTSLNFNAVWRVSYFLNEVQYLN